jgi:acyl-CoA thioesterase I
MLTRALIVSSLLAAQCACAWGADRTIVVLGDSLSSGYGLNSGQSWVTLLANHLDAEAYGYDVVNASIAGDTSTGALARLPALLDEYEPGIVVIELGGNDGLRGQPVAKLRDNLARMIELVRAAGGRPLLTGIRIPPNYGPAYTESFAQVYSDLAAQYEVPLVEFLMSGVALHSELMQPDRIHPNAAGQGPMFDNVWSVLVSLLQRDDR